LLINGIVYINDTVYMTSGAAMGEDDDIDIWGVVLTVLVLFAFLGAVGLAS